MKGSEQAGLTGVKGSMVRKVAIDKTRSSLEKSLEAIKTQLERSRSTLQANTRKLSQFCQLLPNAGMRTTRCEGLNKRSVKGDQTSGYVQAVLSLLRRPRGKRVAPA